MTAWASEHLNDLRYMLHNKQMLFMFISYHLLFPISGDSILLSSKRQTTNDSYESLLK